MCLVRGLMGSTSGAREAAERIRANETSQLVRSIDRRVEEGGGGGGGGYKSKPLRTHGGLRLVVPLWPAAGDGGVGGSVDATIDTGSPVEDVSYPQTSVPHCRITQSHGISTESSAVTGVVGTGGERSY